MSKQIFEMKRVYKKFDTILRAEQHVHSLSKPSKMATYGYSISALECKMGAILYELDDTVCADCYARKGRYIFPDVQHALDMRLNKIKNDPLWIDAMIYLLNHKKIGGKKLSLFRWHDSGDIQSERHLDMMCEIARATPDVKHWLPTKEVATVRNYLKTHDIPKNLNVRISAYRINGKPIKLKGTTTSMVVTKVGDDKRTSNFDCPIYADSSHGKSCGDCTACYDRLITNVTYLKH
jgi:hypothetical protein